MNPEDRHSEALEVELITDPDQKAAREAENVLRQFNTAIEQIEYWLQPDRPFKLRASAILTLNRIALEGLNRYAGNYRPGDVEISGSKHQPPPAHRVPELVENLCDYVNENWGRSPLHLASYVMWRLNWIHPFVDGNGRTTRVISFVVLCVRLGYRVPGSNTVPEQISLNKKPYYESLEIADTIYEKENRIDVSAMETLVGALLTNQLAAVIHDARTDQAPPT
jgi:Fic family protein